MSLELPSLAEAALADGTLLLDADRVVRQGLADRRAAFEVRLDTLPPHHGFAVVSGIHAFHDRLMPSTVNPAAFAEAAQVLGLSAATTARLASARFALDVDAMPDGTLAFPGEALLTLVGPLFDVLLATAVTLPLVRRASSVATQAARLAIAADGDAVLEAASSAEPSREQAALMARAAFVGGCEATTNPVAAALADLPLRASLTPTLAALTADIAASPADPEGWSSLPAESWIPLARSDEEASLLEARRCGERPSGWLVTAFAGPELGCSYDLVSLEEDGAWRPSLSSRSPGRKMAVRYLDAEGRPVRDVVQLVDERLRDPAKFGASSFETLTVPVLRQGRSVNVPEAPQEAALRARTARLRAREGVVRLRSPEAYPVDRSEGLLAAARSSAQRSAAED